MSRLVAVAMAALSAASAVGQEVKAREPIPAIPIVVRASDVENLPIEFGPRIIHNLRPVDYKDAPVGYRALVKGFILRLEITPVKSEDNPYPNKPSIKLYKDNYDGGWRSFGYVRPVPPHKDGGPQGQGGLTPRQHKGYEGLIESPNRIKEVRVLEDESSLKNAIDRRDDWLKKKKEEESARSRELAKQGKKLEDLNEIIRRKPLK